TWGPYPVQWLANSRDLIVPAISSRSEVVSKVPAPHSPAAPAVSVFTSTPPPLHKATGGVHVFTPNRYSGTLFNLALLDTQNGAIRTLAKHIYPDAMQLSPRQDRLAYLIDV